MNKARISGRVMGMQPAPDGDQNFLVAKFRGGQVGGVMLPLGYNFDSDTEVFVPVDKAAELVMGRDFTIECHVVGSRYISKQNRNQGNGGYRNGGNGQNESSGYPRAILIMDAVVVDKTPAAAASK